MIFLFVLFQFVYTLLSGTSPENWLHLELIWLLFYIFFFRMLPHWTLEMAFWLDHAFHLYFQWVWLISKCRQSYLIYRTIHETSGAWRRLLPMAGGLWCTRYLAWLFAKRYIDKYQSAYIQKGNIQDVRTYFNQIPNILWLVVMNEMHRRLHLSVGSWGIKKRQNYAHGKGNYL